MKVKSLLLILIVMFISFSCGDDEMTVNLKEAGVLKAEFMQGEIPVANTMIYLLPNFGYSKGSSYIDEALDKKETDVNGIVDFGEVNTGNYMLVTDGVVVSGLEYKPERVVQAVSGTEKIYKVNVLDYAGEITLLVESYNATSGNNEPVSGIKVVVLLNEDYNSVTDMDDRIPLAIATGTSGTDGKVTFEMPSGFTYRVIAYTTLINGSVDAFDTSNSITLDTGEEYDEILNI